MDFIEKLPPSSDFNTILVIVDWLLKQSIFILTCNTITSIELAKLFVIYVFSKHGVPSHITSDQGSKFMSSFFQTLGKTLNMKLHFTSIYHSEGNGQTKHANQTLEQYLQIYSNYQHSNWSNLLLLVWFTYNNTLNATTCVSPFFANNGYNSNLSAYAEWDLVSTTLTTL